MHCVVEKPDCNWAAANALQGHGEGGPSPSGSPSSPSPTRSVSRSLPLPPPTAAPQIEKSSSTGTGGPQGHREERPTATRPHSVLLSAPVIRCHPCPNQF